MLGKILRLTILASLLAPVSSFAQGNQGRERHILELRWAPASGWSFRDLTSEIPAPVADSPGARPAGYVRNADSTQHVVYRGTDGHIYELWWDATQCSQTTCWHWGNLTGSTGASTLAASNPAGYVRNADGTQHVVYRGTDNHIYELWWDATQCSQTTCWHWGNLTGSSGAPTLAAGDPAGYVRNADSTQHVIYRGTDGHIYELWWDGTQCSQTTCWHWGNLTASSGAPTLAGGNPTGYVRNADGTQHVIYRGDDDHIYELWWDATQCSQTTCWHWGNLTASSGAPTLAGGNSIPAGYVLDADGTQHVVYRGADNHIYELWWDATQCSQTTCWHWGNLTGSTGAPAALGEPAGYVLNADGTQHVVYPGPDSDIYELWWNATQCSQTTCWHWGNLTALTRAPAAAGNPSGYVLNADATQHVVVAIRPPQRKSINALTARELMSLQRGVAQMIAWNTSPRDSADFRRSWVFWANMHAHFDCFQSAGASLSWPGMAGVQTFTPSNDRERATWCKCEHNFSDKFLTWHRMYLWYFERVLQAAAGDPSLRLPFWDYANDPNLPAAYRDPTYVNEAGQTVPNPLRVDARAPSLNNGSAGLTDGVRFATGAMQETTFLPFSNMLEGTPHGLVHCAVTVGPTCRSGLMGAVASSALDPIFWAHHTNIDRLYECWLGVDETARLPSDPTHLDTQFTFVDADGSAPRRRVSDMLRGSQLGYTYAQGGDCPRPAMARVITVTASASEQTFALAGRTRIERGVTTVPLSIPPRAREVLSAQAPSGGRRVYVVIEGLKFDENPGALYNVYLKGDGDRREQIGVIGFFHLTGAHHDSGADRFTFNATEAMQRLAIGAAMRPQLIFEPTTGLTDSSPEAAARSISPQSNVRFDSAQIVVEP
jgi:Common central domain of tyrosinase/Polyphenol oxidase middle domain